MEWLYITGIALNAFGYIYFTKDLTDVDNTPVLNGIKAGSAIIGLALIGIGFAVFEWWVPIIGLVFGPVVATPLFSRTPIGGYPQLAIALGIVIAVTALIAAP